MKNIFLLNIIYLLVFTACNKVGDESLINGIKQGQEQQPDEETPPNNTPNTAPNLFLPQGVSIPEGSTKQITISSSDAEDNDVVIEFANNLPNFVVAQSNQDGSISLSIKPQSGDAGNYSLEVSAIDSFGAMASSMLEFIISSVEVEPDPDPEPEPEPEPVADEYAHFADISLTDQQKNEIDDRILNSAVQPPNVHPRIFGTDAQWYERIKFFDELDPDCKWKGKDAWGQVKNMKGLWDYYTKGEDICVKAAPTNIASHRDAAFYLTTNTLSYSRDRAMRVLHLIRRQYACHQVSSNCQFSKSSVDDLVQAFITYHINRQKSEAKNAKGFYPSWHSGYSGEFFDLGSLPAFKFWCLFLDIFWSNPKLSAADKQFVSDELENEINNYLTIYNLPESSSATLGRWAVWNGNNWTSVLNAAALYWAITFWHEKPQKAQDVLNAILTTNWLHRDFFLADGAYIEGPSYFDVTMNGILDMNELFKSGFDQPLHTVKWKHLSQKTTRWLLDNVASDGLLIDFGDAWANTGYASFYFLQLLTWEEHVGIKPHGSSSVDSCKAKEFFKNSYFAHFFYDIWKITPVLAKDWKSITEQCDEASNQAILTSVFPNYQLGIQRIPMLGETATAQNAGDNFKLLQADQTMLTMNAVDNSLPHREVDFGALIWVAFGNRLLVDWGYGELSNTYEYVKITGSTGRYVKESNNDRLEFYIKQVDKTIDLSKLRIGLALHYIQKDLPISTYLSSVGTTWAKVSIPLIDFGFEESRWTAIRGEAGDTWANPGLEQIYFRTNGAVSKGHIGIDEIKLVNANNPSKNVTWYGDSYNGSIADGARIEVTEFHFENEETSNGANSTAKWMNVYTDSSGRIYRLNYNNDLDALVLANVMDFLPIGANTLVIPGATDGGNPRTNKSQFKGESGTITNLNIDGQQVMFANGSDVYGANQATGNLDYFYRYTVALDSGHFIVVDSFKAKAGKEDLIQEFWYTKTDPVKSDCSYVGSREVTLTKVSNQAIKLEPRCNGINSSGASENLAMITAASLSSASFQTGAPAFLKNNPYFSRYINGDVIKLKNRINNWEYRKLFRYEPAANVSEDVRVFLLQSSVGSLKAASVTKTNCGTNKACFNVNDGENTYGLELNKVNGRYTLEAIK
ncbi:MAG: hypothetical protein JNM93_11505 [Bacteriovoracaceae bacterium]|nr:hypothetical protein [Bacteriovoracaceae bacterium]